MYTKWTSLITNNNDDCNDIPKSNYKLSVETESKTSLINDNIKKINNKVKFYATKMKSNGNNIKKNNCKGRLHKFWLGRGYDYIN